MNDDEKQFIVMLGRGFGMLEAQQFRNLEIGAVRQFLPRWGAVIRACRIDAPDVAASWTPEGTVALLELVDRLLACFLRKAEPGLRIRAEQFRLYVRWQSAGANQRAYAFFAEWERIVGAEQDAVRAHDLD